MDPVITRLEEKNWRKKIFEDTILTDFRLLKDTIFKHGDTTAYIVMSKCIFRNCNIQSIPQSNVPDEMIFHRPVEFTNCDFYSTSNRTGIFPCETVFDSSVNLLNNLYSLSSFFYDVEFKKDITILGVKPNRKINYPGFDKCSFREGLYFTHGLGIEKQSDSFVTDLVIRNSFMMKKLDLSGCVFDSSSKLVLENVTLPDTLDFSNVRLSGLLDLTNVLPNFNGRKISINLWNTDVDKIKLQYQDFQLYFPIWTKENPFERDKVSNFYQSLLSNFKKYSYDDSYRKLDIEFKDWQSDHDFWMWISKWCIAVNLRPEILEQIENGQHDIRFKTLFALCEYYVIDIESIVGKGELLHFKLA